MKNTDLESIRREYGDRALLEVDAPNEPLVLLKQWLQQAIDADVLDATAMVLSTVSTRGMPNSRVVLLKQCDSHALVFYSSYLSEKANDISSNSQVALNFYWAEFARQIRIQGVAKRLVRQEGKAYFATRPIGSQKATVAFNQEKIIASRKVLEQKLDDVNTDDLHCPAGWGGYRIVPKQVEFFQGRDNRCHDRLRYVQSNNQWTVQRLTP